MIGPSSSSSAPSLMTRMLEALDVRDGHRVLEIGTGVRHNAALLSHRLGEQHVFSVDVKPCDEARRRMTTVRSERLWENAPLWFLIHLWEGGRMAFGYAMDPQTRAPGPLFLSSHDGSWCECSTANDDGIGEVWEGGPRRLWATSRRWHQQGEPGWSRFGLTVLSNGRQMVWLDEPASENQWPLPLT